MVKNRRSTPAAPWELGALSGAGGGGTRGVAVKCLDTPQNTGRGGGRPGAY